MISIIIPTLLQTEDILKKLIFELVNNKLVGEVIVIDNSTKGFSYKNEKVRVINLDENIFVNPAWNLGVKEAKFDFLGILNDDLLLPLNYIEQVYEFMKDKRGIAGLGEAKIVDKEKIKNYPKNSKLKFKEIKNLAKDIVLGFGSAYFLKKEDYYFIPEELKIYCGDNFLTDKTLENNKKLYLIKGATVYHCHRATSGKKEFNELLYKDQKKYEEINPKYIEFCKERSKPNFIQNIFSIKNEGEYKILRIFYVKIKFKRKQNKSRV